MTQIYLIGLMHEDLDVPQKLKLELNKINPDIVTLEWDKKLNKIEWDFIKAIKKLNVNDRIHKEFGRIFLPLEYIATVKYCYHTSKPLMFIDSRDKEELIDIETNRIELFHYLKQMNSHEREWWMSCKIAQNKTRQMVQTYEKNLDAKFELDEALKDSSVGLRDKIMADRILDIYNRLGPEEKITHIGGLSHMMKDTTLQTLYERLKPFKPKVIPLLKKYTQFSNVRQHLDY